MPSETGRPNQLPEPDWWAAARERERKRLGAIMLDDQTSEPYFDFALRRFLATSNPEWVAPRPEPRLPSLWRVAKYWAEEDPEQLFSVDPDRPNCFACGRVVPEPVGETPEQKWNNSGNLLQRGHLVNRARYGLDGVQNLVPLCRACNMAMPIFESAEIPGPIEWVIGGGILLYYDIGEDGEFSQRAVPAWPPMCRFQAGHLPPASIRRQCCPLACPDVAGQAASPSRSR